MEAMGADVSQKIRSAIKAKLIELGVYIDDELPDYIMVMVANKKTKSQMDEDLQLFLAANTSKFTTWLHEVLQRLQSVTCDPGKKKITEDKEISIIREENDNYDIQDEILAIKAEQEEDDLLAEELSLNKTNESSPSKEKKKSNEKTIIENTQMRGIKRRVPITLNQSSPAKRKAPISQVGAILMRKSRDEDEDDEDFHNSGIASVVKISERRSSVPPYLQANKNLIMRAVAEAKKSVLQSTKKIFEIPNVVPQLYSTDVEMVDDEDEINSKRCIISAETEKNVASPTFIVTLDGVDPSDFPKFESPSFLSETMDLDDYEILIDSDNENGKESPTKNTERCKYWPTCKNGNDCSYRHPSKQCKTFPNCRFGDKCHYIHPNCKYDATCARQTCPYTHASKRILTQIPHAILLAPKLHRNSSHKKPPQQQCKFYPKCSNLNCAFYHPKPCRYGLSCTQAGCSFFHPPLPSRDQLKWTSSSSTQTI